MIGEFLRRKLRTEIRAAGGYTDLILAGIDHTVRGTDADTQVTGALEVSAGMWARALAAAEVKGTDALTRRVRHRIGRDIIRGGESVFEVVTENGRAELAPVAYWEVLAGWRYKLETTEPPGDTTAKVVARERVAHFLWSESLREPWRGVAPLAAASKLGVLAARVEAKLAEDLATPTAHLVPIPCDGGSPKLDELKGDIGKARGAAVLLEGTTGGWEETRNQAGTRNDWKAQRLGPEIPDGLRETWKDVLMAVGNACGIPSGLLDPSADGTAQREAYRRWIMASVQPVADMVAEVAGEALDTEITVQFNSLHAQDITGRSNAMSKLVTAGMSLEDAQKLVGLTV